MGAWCAYEPSCLCLGVPRLPSVAWEVWRTAFPLPATHLCLTTLWFVFLFFCTGDILPQHLLCVPASKTLYCTRHAFYYNYYCYLPPSFPVKFCLFCPCLGSTVWREGGLLQVLLYVSVYLEPVPEPYVCVLCCLDASSH
jgi:hypothetical protein